MIVPTAPGGTPDVLARLIAQKLSEKFAIQFVVENIPGAGHNIGMGVARRAKPDGYTILIAMSTLMVNPMIYASVPYDPVRDFAPVALVGTAPFVLVVSPDVPA